MKRAKTDLRPLDNDMHFVNHDMYIDNQIQDYVTTRRKIEIGELIEYISKKVKCSGVNTRRHISDLARIGKLIKIYPEDFKKFDITKTDKRFVYVASKETKDMKDYIDAIFKQLESNDTSKIKFAIKELKNFEKNYFKAYFLDSDQLNTLSNILDKSMQVDDLKDPEFRCDLLGIILNEITMNRTEPTNKKAFLETLKSLLDKCPSQDYFAKPYNPIPFIIKILGIYRDKAVIERLKQDTKTLPPQVLNDTIVCYNTKFTAKVIEQNKIDLFNLGTELQNSNKKEAIAFLDQIRNQAINDLTMLKGFGDIEEYLYR